MKPLGIVTSFFRQVRMVSLRGWQAVLNAVMTGQPWGFDSSAIRQYTFDRVARMYGASLQRKSMRVQIPSRSPCWFSSMVEQRLPNPKTRVRFSYPVPVIPTPRGAGASCHRIGWGSRVRTCNRLNQSQMPYQLGHTPMVLGEGIEPPS